MAFADTLYFVALFNPRDQWHERAVAAHVPRVRDVDEARKLNFHGSPSVVVEGVDVEGPEVAAREASFS